MDLLRRARLLALEQLVHAHEKWIDGASQRIDEAVATARTVAVEELSPLAARLDRLESELRKQLGVDVTKGI